MTNAIGAYAEAEAEAEAGWYMPMGKLYLAVKEKKTWDQARATCQKLGGDLAQIRTVYDQKAVAKFLTDNFAVGSWSSASGTGNGGSGP